MYNYNYNQLGILLAKYILLTCKTAALWRLTLVHDYSQ